MDEGIAVLQSAMNYLYHRAMDDYADQETGEFEAYAILEQKMQEISQMYECQQCGKALNHRGGWCSARCRAAYDL